MALNFGQGLFPPRKEFLINFDWIDVTTRTGYITFYPAKTNGAWVVVTSPTIKSDSASTKAASDDSPISVTIDLVFNQPVNLKGDIFFNVPIGVESDSTASTFKCIIDAYHYDGSTETQIGAQALSIQYRHESDATPPGSNEAVALLKVETGSTIHFKAGEIFRVKLQVFSGRNNPAFDFGFAHDPTNAADFFPVSGSLGGFLFSAGLTRQAWILPFKLPF